MQYYTKFDTTVTKNNITQKQKKMEESGNDALFFLPEEPRHFCLSNGFYMKAGKLILRYINHEKAKYIINPKNYLSTNEANMVIELVNLIFTYDKRLFQHSLRTAIYSFILGEICGYEDSPILFVGGLLHDIGKIFVPGDILYKPSKLTEDEFVTIKDHPTLGYRFLIRHGIRNDDILNIVKYHHRYYDGKGGYPDEYNVALGLTQFITLADSFDAMTSDRVYSPGMSVEEVVKELKRCAGQQFSPYHTDVFAKHSEHFIELSYKAAG